MIRDFAIFLAVASVSAVVVFKFAMWCQEFAAKPGTWGRKVGEKLCDLEERWIR
jgi:hypothetical protein